MVPYSSRKRRWRFYRTVGAASPAKDFIRSLSDADAAEVEATMKDVEVEGMSEARHLRDDIYEVRADGENQTFRILFATEGRSKQILLALSGFSKKTQKTPQREIDLAASRLADWRRRGRH